MLPTHLGLEDCLGCTVTVRKEEAEEGLLVYMITNSITYTELHPSPYRREDERIEYSLLV